ncbi:MAG: hypothetical protein JNK85_09900 [Verrucomicrobiales bacterium]|nr:hypothetical protein [Verrucomicrobiales bacterium]
MARRFVGPDTVYVVFPWPAAVQARKVVRLAVRASATRKDFGEDVPIESW